MRCDKEIPLYRPWEAPNHGCVSFGFIERAKTMIKTGLTSLRCLVLLACIWAQADTVTAQQPRVPMPAKNSPQYWVLRSEAVRELTRFMTKKRTELKRKYNHFPRYLDQIGKRKDYGSRNIKVPDDMDLSADSYICVGWSVPNTSANMTWGYGYLITAENDDTEAAATTGTTQVTSSSTPDGLNVDSIATISGGTIGDSDVCIHMYIYRDVSADTYGNPVDLHGITLKYTANKLGEAT